MLRDTAICVGPGPIPMGDNPRNNPSNPAIPKLRATDNTNVSTKSILFFPVKRILTKQ